MTYKIVNQYGKIIDGKERTEILDKYLSNTFEILLDNGEVKIIKANIGEKETIIEVEVTVF